jgi:predicted transcriptional regulator
VRTKARQHLAVRTTGNHHLSTVDKTSPIMLDQGRFTSARELAEAERVGHSYVGRILRVTLLAPDIVEHILDGRRAPQLADLMHPFPVELGEPARAVLLSTTWLLNAHGAERCFTWPTWDPGESRGPTSSGVRMEHCKLRPIGLSPTGKTHTTWKLYSVPESLKQTTLAELTAEIVSAYVSSSQITPSDLGTLVSAVAGELRNVGTRLEQPAESKIEPAVPVRRSIGRDHLVCLVCGKKQKLLKRHVAVEHGLTPSQYRELFDLKPDYPMTAPSYTEKRRQLALQIGLGQPKKPARQRRKKPTTESSTSEAE